MRSPGRIALVLFSCLALSLVGFAQSGIITTYAGPALPVNGAMANTQAIDYPMSVAPGWRRRFLCSKHESKPGVSRYGRWQDQSDAGTSVPGLAGTVDPQRSSAQFGHLL